MSPQLVRVLVLYSHPLMGEGLERMLAAERGVAVDAVDIAQPDAVAAALAREPGLIVVEEGGAVDAADVVRRSSCPIVLDVDITTTTAWTLRREVLSTRPDEFLAAIRAVVNGVACGADPAAAGAVTVPDLRPEIDVLSEIDLALRPLVVPG